MNKIVTSIVIASLILFTSCSLKEDLYGAMSLDDFYKTEADAESAISNVYGTLGMSDSYGKCYLYAVGLSADDVMSGADSRANDQDYAELGTTAMKYGPQSTNQFIQLAFRSAYLTINLSNYVITYVPNCQMDELYRNNIIGEAYFLRAWQYFNLVRMFGKVPLRNEPIQNQNQIHKELSSIEAVYNQIIGDLNSAITNLQKIRRVGRVDNWGAQTMMAKVWLTMATSAESGLAGYEFVDVEEAYSKAKIFASGVLDDPTCPYHLEMDELWNIYDIKQRENCERMFCIALDHSGTAGNDFEVSKLPMFWTPAVGVGDQLTLKTAIGDKKVRKGFSSFCYNQFFIEQAEEGDKRISELVVNKFSDGATPPVTYSYNGGAGRANFRGPFTIKYIDEEYVGQSHTALIPIIRFSDLALIFAEADGGQDEKSYDILNKIRNRAGLSSLSGLSVEEFRKAVLKERKFEFMGEFERMYDIRRTGTVEEAFGAIGKIILSGIDPYFFPLPAKELDMNGGIKNN